MSKTMQIEALESRRMLNAAVLFNGVLSVTGDTGGNKIVVGETSGAISVTFGGKAAVGSPFSGVSLILINGKQGNDTITVESSVSASQLVDVVGGNGADSITVDGGHGTIAGGPGGDHIAIEGGEFYANGGKGFDTIVLTSGENEILHGANGSDSISVSGGGDDLVFGGSGGNTFDVVGGNDTVISGSGADHLTADGGATALLFDMSGGDTVTGNVDSDLGGDTIYTSGKVDSITDGSQDVVNPGGVTHPPDASQLLSYLQGITDPAGLPPTI